MTKPFAVLVICYNGANHLQECFSSLLRSDALELADIYLVDNRSTDNSVALTERLFPNVKVIQTGSNLGFSGAYNFADGYLKKHSSDYDYYFILNDDTICPDLNLFSRTRQIFRANPEIGIVNPTVIDKAGRIQFQGGDYLFPVGTTFGHRRGEKFQAKDKLVTSRWATGCALFIPAKLFRELHGFDDYFMYQEDVGLSWKAMNTGRAVVTDCQSAIVHLEGGTKKSSTFEHYFSERNRVWLFWQNLSILTFLVTLPFFLLLRLATLVRTPQPKVVAAKLRGLVTGLALMLGQPRRNNSISNDLRVIQYFWRPQEEYSATRPK